MYSLTDSFTFFIGANDLLICGSNCAEDGEKKYKKAAKDSDAKGCKKSCPEDDDGSCEKACKSLGKCHVNELLVLYKLLTISLHFFSEKEAKKDAEKAATKEYESCNKKCFKEDSLISAFKVRCACRESFCFSSEHLISSMCLHLHSFTSAAPAKTPSRSVPRSAARRPRNQRR